MVPQKKKNHFYEICVEIRKIIFSYLNINKFIKKVLQKKKNLFYKICVENRKKFFFYKSIILFNKLLNFGFSKKKRNVN